MTTSQQMISRRAYVCFIAVCMICLLHSAFLQLADPLQLNWDPSMYLHFAQSMLGGGVPYVDLVDINPPLIFYLSCLPAWISQQIDLHIIVVFKLLMVGFSFASFGLILASVQNRIKRDKHALYIAMVLFVIANIGPAIGREFGQREHIFVIAFLPFFFCRWMRWENEKVNSWIAISSGAMAAIGLCLKPHFLVMPIICELYWLSQYRDWKKMLSPEIFSCLFVGVLYPLHFLVIPDAMRKPFMQLIAEFPLFQTHYGCSTLVCCILGGDHWPHVLLAFLSAVMVGFCLRKQHSIVMPVFLYTLAAYACVILQHKRWDYYKIPMWIGILMLGGILVAWSIYLAAEKISKIESAKVFLPVVSVMAVLVVAGFSVLDISKTGAVVEAFKLEDPRRGRTLRADLVNALEAKARTYPTLFNLMKYSQPGDGAMMLCEILMPEYPAVVQYGLTMGCRYPFQFPLILNKLAEVEAKKKKDDVAAKKFQTRVVQELDLVLADVRKKQPKVIIIEQDIPALNAVLIDAKTSQPSEFNERLLSGYRLVTTYQDRPDTQTWTYKLYLRDSEH